MTPFLRAISSLIHARIIDWRTANVIEACAVTGRAPDFRLCPWCGARGHGLGGECQTGRLP